LNNFCTICPDGMYLSGTNCVECPENCETCSDEDTCLACEEGFGLQDDLCDICPDGTYVSGDSCLGLFWLGNFDLILNRLS